MPLALRPISEIQKYWEELLSRQNAVWKMPMYVMSDESEMDWDDEEEITQPGTGHVYKLEAAPVSIPTVTAEGLSKSDRCYLCAGNVHLLRFTRAPGDNMVVCVWCLYGHLGWDLLPSGELSKVPSEI